MATDQERQQRLDQIIADYEAATTGSAPGEAEWLARYPEFAGELAQFFADRRLLRSLTAHEPIKSLGTFELIEEIGRGGMGIVYKARQPGLDRVVAVKTIRGGPLATESDVKRFHREARLAAGLRHPNIVTIHEVGEQDGLHFFSMEFVEGRSLAEQAACGPLDPEQAARCLQQVAEAIHYAHQNGVLHRDLKPSNILIDSSSRPMVTDFGLARSVRQESRYTVAGTILGTLSYMSPEQAEGRQADVDVRSDVYSLGAVLYEALTGRPPCQGKTPEETFRQVLSVPPVPPRTLRTGVPADLEAVCLKCLEKNPADRYGSAREMADEIRRFLAGQSVLASPPSVWGTLRRLSLLARLEATVSKIGLVAGPLLALIIGFGPRFGLSLAPDRPELNAMAAVALLMLIWWLTEAIPTAATALLPLILLPALGIAKLGDVSKLYMHDVILMALGGCFISAAVEETGLVKRLALRMVAATGDHPRRIVLGFMIATAGVSLWVPNVAAAIIMLPAAVSVLSEIEESTAASVCRNNLAAILMLSIAYAATIGGLATPFGTLATQNFLASQEPDVKLTPLAWMVLGVPFAACLGLVGWIVLTRLLFPLGTEPVLGGPAGVRSRLASLGPLSAAERRMCAIAVVTPLLWIFSEPIPGWGWAPLLHLTSRSANAIAALAMAVVCFAVPAGGPARRRLMEWDFTSRVPWGVLFIFGGGLALGAGIRSSGLDSYFANLLASVLQGVPSDTGKLLGITTFVAVVTQMMSNFATQEITSPILTQVAGQLSLESRPILLAGLLASFCSFLLPASTPPNAVVYGSGRVRVRDMIRAGFWLTLAGIILDVVLVRLLAA